MEFHRTEFRVLSSGHIALLNLVNSFLLSMSRNVLELIYKFQIVFEKHAIFRVRTYIVIRMGKKYLSAFKSLKAKEKARPLSVMNLKVLI